MFSAHCGLRWGFDSKAPEGYVKAAAMLEQTHKSTSPLRALKEPSPSLEVFALATSLLRTLTEPSASLEGFALAASHLWALKGAFCEPWNFCWAFAEPSRSLRYRGSPHGAFRELLTSLPLYPGDKMIWWEISQYINKNNKININKITQLLLKTLKLLFPRQVWAYGGATVYVGGVGSWCERDRITCRHCCQRMSRVIKAETRRKEARAKPLQKILVLYQSNRMFLGIYLSQGWRFESRFHIVFLLSFTETSVF